MQANTSLLSLAALLMCTGLCGPARGAANPPETSLARVTFYSAEACRWGNASSTGIHLVEGLHVAVDPEVIPYGSSVKIPGLGVFTAVDTGTDVRLRTAAIKAADGRPEKARAIVVDVFVEKESTLHRIAGSFPHFVEITWDPPGHAILPDKTG